MTNKDLAQLVDFYINQSGVTKQFLADKLKVKRQQIARVNASGFKYFQK